MALRLVNLDSRTRRYMMEELEHDVERGQLYFSPRLSERGRRDYESLLRAAIESLNDVLLADSLRVNDRLKNWEQRHAKNGEVLEVKVPYTAADTLAEGEFNRYYVRGVCRRALEEGARDVVIYRAKQPNHPRPQSEALLGRRMDARELLNALRGHHEEKRDETPLLVIPPGPNSGLSVKLPQ
jgi:hypothetical protein